MRNTFGFATGLALAAMVATAQAQMGGMSNALQIAQARQANAALMHQYTWNSRTEIIQNGMVKDIRIDLVQFGPYGQLQQTLLNDQPGAGAATLPTPIGFLRRRLQQDEAQMMQQYLTGLKQLLELYTLPSTGKIYDFLLSAVPQGPDANGMFTLTGYNIVQPGDNMTMIVNPWTRHPRQVTVNTTFQGDPVQLVATCQTIPVSGLNYAAFAEATVPAKTLSV